MDVTSAHVRDSVSAPSGALVRPAQVGLWAPSPIWTDTVLERFEFMINRPDVKEREIQSFFELYPSSYSTNCTSRLTSGDVVPKDWRRPETRLRDSPPWIGFGGYC